MFGARAARALYTLLIRAATPLYFVRLWWRGRHEPAYRQYWNERLGLAAGAPPTGRLWLHAVSLGETHAAAPLIEALRAQRPGLRLLLTHGTATGREAGSALLREGDAQAWLPWDTPGAIGRFMRAHQPVAGVIMETEVWPNLLHGADDAGVPLLLVNARLSERSAARGARVRVLLQPALARFTQVLAQTEADAARLRAAGAVSVRVTGNVKFDLTPPDALLALGRQWRAALARPVVLAASTRDGEEAALLRAWQSAPDGPLLLLVPRHPQRFDTVAQALASAGLTAVRRSDFGATPSAAALAADAWLGDSLGEMAAYYAMADVALLGGSFEPLGGQNLIEAAACGCPLLMGPHTFNFEQAAEMSLAAGASMRVPDLEAGVRQARVLVAAAGDGPRVAMARQAIAFAEQHRGVADRTAAAVLAQMPMDAVRTGHRA